MSVVVGLLLAAEGGRREGERPHSAHVAPRCRPRDAWTAHLLLCCVVLPLLVMVMCAWVCTRSRHLVSAPLGSHAHRVNGGGQTKVIKAWYPVVQELRIRYVILSRHYSATYLCNVSVAAE